MIVSFDSAFRRRVPGRLAVLALVFLAPASGGLASNPVHGPAKGAEKGGPPVRIELRPEVEVSQPQVTLGDVAVLDTRDLATLERLVALQVGTAPWVGAARVERAALARWIGARTGLREAQIEWRGPGESVVRMATQSLAGEEVAERAREALRTAISRERLEARISLREIPANTGVPVGRVQLRARRLPRAALLARRTTVWVDASVDGRFARTVPVAFELEALGPGYVARASRASGETLDASEVEVQEVGLAGRDVLPVSSGALEGVRLRWPVQAGEVLTRAHLEPSPLVTRGGSATLHVEEGVVRLESRVEVLQDGRAGEVVRVRIPGGKGEVRAKVTGPATLEVP